jgi:hypothetical protein
MIDGAKGETHLGVFAGRIIRDFPNLKGYLSAFTIETIESIPTGSAPLFPPDSFGPLDAAALQYPFELSTIQFISTEAELAPIDFEASDLLGFDCEWKAGLTRLQTYPVALFQIATRENTYLLDMLSLAHSPVLNTKLSALFLNQRVRKLGLSFDGDRKQLIRSYPLVPAFSIPISSYVDLQLLYQRVFPEEGGSGGLAMLTSRFLGVKLCKAEQVSNWARRPLRSSQIHYAALDSMVEILIWERMNIEASARGIDLTHISSETQEKLIGKPGKAVKICKQCGETGHKSKRCPKGRLCDLCYQIGHIAATCPTLNFLL